MPKPIKTFLFSISLFAALTSTQSYACSCLALSDKQLFENAGLVFVGTVIQSNLISSEQADDLASQLVSTTVKVKQRMKGELGESVEIIGDIADGANCGVGLLTGRDYLFYLPEDKLVSLCSGT